MADLNKSDYYSRRERQERALAGSAKSPDVSRIHEDMADRYATLQAEADPVAKRPTLRLFTR